MDVLGKVVLITGASAGIGLCTARRFAESGAKLSLVARSTDLLEKLADELRGQGAEAITVPTDMRDPDQVNRAIAKTFAHFGRIDILINNAGQAVLGTIADLDLDQFRQVVELNVFGPVAAMQSVVPIMREQGGGIIINVTSMVSKMKLQGLAGYACTKSALNMISDTARDELARDNIRVISVYPRMTATDFHTSALGGAPNRERPAPTQSGPVIIDTPEYVADRILSAAINEPEEQFMDR
jgi:NADP-dependent 3-hydroxy acid dehydrogenase YdfG